MFISAGACYKGVKPITVTKQTAWTKTHEDDKNLQFIGQKSYTIEDKPKVTKPKLIHIHMYDSLHDNEKDKSKICKSSK